MRREWEGGPLQLQLLPRRWTLRSSDLPLENSGPGLGMKTLPGLSALLTPAPRWLPQPLRSASLLWEPLHPDPSGQAPIFLAQGALSWTQPEGFCGLQISGRQILCCPTSHGTLGTRRWPQKEWSLEWGSARTDKWANCIEKAHKNFQTTVIYTLCLLATQRLSVYCLETRRVTLGNLLQLWGWYW